MGRRNVQEHHYHHYHGPPPPPGPADYLVGWLAFIGGALLLGYFTFIAVKQWVLAEFLPDVSERLDVFFLTLPQPYRLTLDFYSYTIGLPFKAAGYIWTKLFTEGLTGFFLIDLPITLFAIFFNFLMFVGVLVETEKWLQSRHKNPDLYLVAGFLSLPIILCFGWGVLHLIYVIIT